MTDLVIGSVFAVVVLAVLLIPSLRRKRIRASVDRLAVQSGLAITEEALPLLLRWRRATWVGYSIGVSIGFELGALVSAGAVGVRGGLGGTLVPTAVWLLTGGLGSLVGGLIGARSALSSGPRIARERRVDVADYVDPGERRLAVGLGAGSLLIGLLPIAADARDASTAAVAGAIAASAVAATSLIARRIVAAPQRADTTRLLAWDDALRATTARTVIQAGTTLALFSLTLSLPIWLRAVGVTARLSDLRLDVLLGVTVALTIVAIRSMRQAPARYFLRRLWPATAAEADRNERSGMEVSS